jgi:protein-L-isoaspartate(D-aspartate) O-methyltransferase
MMAPKIEGRLLQSLRLEPADCVLEIGTGTGFLTACLAKLVDRVESVDIFADFVDVARARLDRHGIRNAVLECRDATTLAHVERYDAIAVTASVPTLTEHFIRMLRPRGRLFVVVGRPPVMEARLVTMHAQKQWTQESLFETMLTPMLNADQAEPFVL